MVKHRKPAERRRTLYLRVRLTPDAHARITEAADAANITVSAWVVDRLMKAARAERRETESE